MVKRTFYLLSLAWLTVAMVGCGAGTAEIKAKTEAGQMTPEQKKAMEAEMQKSMQRSGYQGQPGVKPPGTN